MPDYAYRPHEEPGWPWVVLEDKAIVLPERPPMLHEARHFAISHVGSQRLLWIRGEFVDFDASPYRFDGPTLWPKRLRRWLWPRDCRCWECWLRRRLYLALDLPGRWLMRRWGDAFAAHDALVQVAEGLMPPEGISMRYAMSRNARAFRRYADRQMRLMIRPMPGKKTTGPLSLRWQLDRLLAFTVRWLAWLAVRADAGWRRVRG